MDNILSLLFLLDAVVMYSEEKNEVKEAQGAMSKLIQIAHLKESQWHNRTAEVKNLNDLVQKYYKSEKIKHIFTSNS